MMPTLAKPFSCVVCGARLPRSAGAGAHPLDGYPTCTTVACRMVVARRAQMDAAGFKHYLQLQARLTMERAANMLVSHARENAEARENAAAWRDLRAKVAHALTEPLQLLVPSGPARARRASVRRRARYRAHLIKLLGEAPAADATLAGAGVDADAPPRPDGAAADASPLSASGAVGAPSTSTPAAPSAMPGHLCGLCRGGCCTHGGEHAYLTAATLRRVMARHAAMSDDELVAAYLEHLPDKSQVGSCINHTSTGCALPTDMRSDTCNAYACEALARLQHLQRGAAGPHVVLVLRRRQDNWRRLDADNDNAISARAALTETGARQYRIFSQPKEN